MPVQDSFATILEFQRIQRARYRKPKIEQFLALKKPEHRMEIFKKEMDFVAKVYNPNLFKPVEDLLQNMNEFLQQLKLQQSNFSHIISAYDLAGLQSIALKVATEAFEYLDKAGDDYRQQYLRYKDILLYFNALMLHLGKIEKSLRGELERVVEIKDGKQEVEEGFETKKYESLQHYEHVIDFDDEPQATETAPLIKQGIFSKSIIQHAKDHFKDMWNNLKKMFEKPDFLKDVPDELIIKILNYLSPKDLLRFSETCIQFNLIAKDKALWKLILKENAFKISPIVSPTLEDNAKNLCVYARWFRFYQRRLLELKPKDPTEMPTLTSGIAVMIGAVSCIAVLILLIATASFLTDGDASDETDAIITGSLSGVMCSVALLSILCCNRRLLRLESKEYRNSEDIQLYNEDIKAKLDQAAEVITKLEDKLKGLLGTDFNQFARENDFMASSSLIENRPKNF